jgi:hypothetical protein
VFAYYHLLNLQIKGLFNLGDNILLPLGIFIFIVGLTLVLKKYDFG